MNTQTSIDKSRAYVISQRQRHEKLAAEHPQLLKPAITISHQTGVGVPEIADQLAQVLQKTEFVGDHPWSVFDHQLIEKALEEQRWPKKLAEKITEENRFFIDELMDDLFGLRPPSWVLVPQIVKTTLHLAITGNAILVGHGATVVTAKLSNVFHVRLTGSLPRRIERIQKTRNLTPDAAAKFVRKEDRNREKYLKKHFHARLDNELLYDLAVNTDRIPSANAVAMISEGAQWFFQRYRTPDMHGNGIDDQCHSVSGSE